MARMSTCKICGRKFNGKRGVATHMRLAHKEPVEEAQLETEEGWRAVKPEVIADVVDQVEEAVAQREQQFLLRREREAIFNDITVTAFCGGNVTTAKLVNFIRKHAITGSIDLESWSDFILAD